MSSTYTRGAVPPSVLGSTVSSMSVTPASSPITTSEGPCRTSASSSSPPPARGTLSVAVSGSGVPESSTASSGPRSAGGISVENVAVVDGRAHIHLDGLQV